MGPEVWLPEQERRGEAASEGRFRTIGEAVAYRVGGSWVGRFRTRSCTPGFGVWAHYGRWRRKRLSGRRRRGKRGLLAVVQAEGLRRGEAVLRRLEAEEKVSSLAPIRRRSL